tara:strand:- start:254 stop:424 length:171 start_codon:yes stop_codon:yes gene_type:complete
LARFISDSSLDLNYPGKKSLEYLSSSVKLGNPSKESNAWKFIFDLKKFLFKSASSF